MVCLLASSASFLVGIVFLAPCLTKELPPAPVFWCVFYRENPVPWSSLDSYVHVFHNQSSSTVILLFISLHSCTILKKKTHFLHLFLCIYICIWLYSVHFLPCSHDMLCIFCAFKKLLRILLLAYFTVIYLFCFKWLFTWFKVILYNE